MPHANVANFGPYLSMGADHDTEDVSKKPFYIGKGKSERCLDHIKCNDCSPKSERINHLLKTGNLGIDILRHGMDEATAKLV
ncbi:hypothetical protein AU059_002614, partial [Enterobacter hormaechei]|nr:hypothetical protein [Enterobacter hormaechei]